jgi:hypothetical protein
MPLGLVMVFWFVIGMVLAVPNACLLMLVAWLTGSRLPTGRRIGRTVFAGLVPVYFVPYMLAAVMAWTIFAGLALGVGPMLGDWWFVPIQDGYELHISNATDWGSINGRGGVRVEDVREAVRAGSWLAGTSKPVFNGQARYFMIDMGADSLAWYESKQDLEAAWAAAGLGPLPELQRSDYLYYDLRPYRYDAAALVAAVLLYGAGVIAIWWRLFAKVPQRGP